MKLKMKNAEDMLKVIQRDNRYAHTYNKQRTEYHAALRKLAGQEVEVETEYLFSDQYNTPPIEGISDIGLRIFDRYVESIIDDIRPGMLKCSWCGRTYHNNGTYCHAEYTKPLLSEFYRDSAKLFRVRGYDMFGKAYRESISV